LDWSLTPLGPLDKWPRSLRFLVDLMLASRQPVYIAWGPELISLYNDGFIPILGGNHPEGLGRPHAELWSETWDEYRPVAEATMKGEAQYFVDQPVALEGRPGRPMIWFTFSWTPVRDDDGAIAGFYCSAFETTEKALRESRDVAVRKSEER